MLSSQSGRVDKCFKIQPLSQVHMKDHRLPNIYHLVEDYFGLLKLESNNLKVKVHILQNTMYSLLFLDKYMYNNFYRTTNKQQ